MIDHFEIKTVQFSACVRFYGSVLQPLLIERKWADADAAGFGKVAGDKVQFLIEKSSTATSSHIAFSAHSKNAVQHFHQAGLLLGATDNGKPGLRVEYAENYYAAFLLDPDGNNIEAVTYI